MMDRPIFEPSLLDERIWTWYAPGPLRAHIISLGRTYCGLKMDEHWTLPVALNQISDPPPACKGCLEAWAVTT